MKKIFKRIFPGIGLALVSVVAANCSKNSSQQAPSAEVQAFCDSHAQDCADLKSLRESAKTACANPGADCDAAREKAHEKMAALKAEGMPARQGGEHHHDNNSSSGNE